MEKTKKIGERQSLSPLLRKKALRRLFYLIFCPEVRRKNQAFSIVYISTYLTYGGFPWRHFYLIFPPRSIREIGVLAPLFSPFSLLPATNKRSHPSPSSMIPRNPHLTHRAFPSPYLSKGKSYDTTRKKARKNFPLF